MREQESKLDANAPEEKLKSGAAEKELFHTIPIKRGKDGTVVLEVVSAMRRWSKRNWENGGRKIA